MINPTQESDNFLKFFSQKKQRIDLYLDMTTKNVIGVTKLIFRPKHEIKDEIPEFFTFYLNSENMSINSVKLDKTEKIAEDKKGFFINVVYCVFIAHWPRVRVPCAVCAQAARNPDGRLLIV